MLTIPKIKPNVIFKVKASLKNNIPPTAPIIKVPTPYIEIAVEAFAPYLKL